MWKIGQKLVCIKTGQWTGVQTKRVIKDLALPAKGDTVTYDGHKRKGFIFLKEYTQCNVLGSRYAFAEYLFVAIEPKICYVSFDEAVRELQKAELTEN